MKINWYGVLSQGDGYAGSSEKIALALEKLGHDVRIVSFRANGKNYLTSAGEQLKRKTFELADIGICYGMPNTFTSLFRNKYKIGFTMFETDHLPTGRNDWNGESGNACDIINNLDMLLVPSEHNKQLFKNSGVKIPIEVVHLGIDPNDYVLMERPERDIFTFYQSGVLTLRKNPGATISAFLDNFKGNKDVRLVMKTKSGTLGHLSMPYSNIEIIDRAATPEEMFYLMSKADCFVFPSRGEGFGLPPLEAMSSGLPTIVADNTGMSEYADERYNYPIRCPKKAPAQRYPRVWGEVGNWYEIDYDQLVKTMKYIYEHKDEARKKGLLAGKWVRDNWTFENTALQLTNAIKKLLK